MDGYGRYKRCCSEKVIVKNPDGGDVTFLTSISRDGSTLNGLRKLK